MQRNYVEDVTKKLLLFIIATGTTVVDQSQRRFINSFN